MKIPYRLTKDKLPLHCGLAKCKNNEAYAAKVLTARNGNILQAYKLKKHLSTFSGIRADQRQITIIPTVLKTLFRGGVWTVLNVDFAFEVEKKLIQPAFIFHLAVWFMLLKVTLVLYVFGFVTILAPKPFAFYSKYKLLILSAEIPFLYARIYTHTHKCA